MTAARPERTYAVVVGAERYAAGPSWDLPGPAADARRFTAWLRGRGVPASHVSLLLAPLPGAGGPGVDVPELPAGREAVQDVLTRRLPALEGDLLWVFWGGHGVTDPQGHRRLFYADAGPDDRRNLDLDAWLTAFSTDLVPGFRRQIWLVDSCQTFVEDLMLARPLPQEIPPGGERLPGREQFVLLASGRGQRAANDPVRQTGAFSRAVLAALAASDGEGAWPPDMAALADTVLREFTGGGQRPTSLWHRSWAGDEHRFDASPAPAASAAPAVPAPRRDAEEPVPDAALAALIGLLADWPGVTDQNQRQLVLGMLPADLAGSIPRHGAARPDIISIVRTCRRHPGGLHALVDALTLLEPGSREQLLLAEWAECWLGPRPGGAPA
ncbi:effector-associated domain 2-containing protein [Streptomyces sp. NRRL F-5727]|uniref:effector-associated domain 2-containing protein n=1 Tax=Streptomyces sp. NRRL F-5727 TaxID=1463871 RepID=UPI000565A7AA|nr:caspase family protein [Streptomyces sp. NRRL F-5727]